MVIDIFESRRELERQIARAEAFVAGGVEHIARQEWIITKLDRGSHPLREAQTLLQSYRQTQVLHQHHVELLRRELSALGPPAVG
jgi:hypothetical protein